MQVETRAAVLTEAVEPELDALERALHHAQLVVKHLALLTGQPIAPG